jgi:hypothetical protein
MKEDETKVVLELFGIADFEKKGELTQKQLREVMRGKCRFDLRFPATPNLPTPRPWRPCI